jgi:molecular chaperone GrpE
MKDHHNSKQPADHKPHEKKADEGKAEAKAAGPSEVEQLKDRILRLQADYDNFRKRTLRDQNEMAARANADFLLQILPIMDHFERGVRDARAHKADKSVVDGFQLIFDQFMGALQKAGLTAISAEGQVFDPNFHEAITHVPSDEFPADVVVTETRRGYLLGDKLLRASQVIVSSGPAVPPSASAAPAKSKQEAPGSHELPPADSNEEAS